MREIRQLAYYKSKLDFHDIIYCQYVERATPRYWYFRHSLYCYEVISINNELAEYLRNTPPTIRSRY